MPHLLIIGGSDAGIEAALRARELDPDSEVTLLVADRYPNFSICGIPYHVSGEVADWRDLAHRNIQVLEKTGMRLLLDHRATAIDPAAKLVRYTGPANSDGQLVYDRLLIATGAIPQRPPVGGLDRLRPGDGVHVVHSMTDTFALTGYLAEHPIRHAVIIGGGYLGLEMAEALTTRGLHVSVLEQLPQLLARTLDPELATHVEAELHRHGVDVQTATTARTVQRHDDQLTVHGDDGKSWSCDLLVVVTGVKPDSGLAAVAGIQLGVREAIVVDRQMRTSAADVWAAGDCAETYHRLLEHNTYLPLGTTAHKQGRIAGENALGGDRHYGGSLGTQVVKVFDLIMAATGLRDQEAAEDGGFDPRTVEVVADDHKTYYPGATPIRIRVTADTQTSRLLGAQLVGRRGAEIAKRVDIYATAIHQGARIDQISELDLSYTPPLGTPWDAVQTAAHAWTRNASKVHA
jgi:NADPH-dependent 2,4-dienoyl-CoA reductase/sulfur reductase-like enzyme